MLRTDSRRWRRPAAQRPWAGLGRLRQALPSLDLFPGPLLQPVLRARNRVAHPPRRSGVRVGIEYPSRNKSTNPSASPRLGLSGPPRRADPLRSTQPGPGASFDATANFAAAAIAAASYRSAAATAKCECPRIRFGSSASSNCTFKGFVSGPWAATIFRGGREKAFHCGMQSKSIVDTALSTRKRLQRWNSACSVETNGPRTASK